MADEINKGTRTLSIREDRVKDLEVSEAEEGASGPVYGTSPTPEPAFRPAPDPHEQKPAEQPAHPVHPEHPVHPVHPGDENPPGRPGAPDPHARPAAAPDPHY